MNLAAWWAVVEPLEPPFRFTLQCSLSIFEQSAQNVAYVLDLLCGFSNGLGNQDTAPIIFPQW